MMNNDIEVEISNNIINDYCDLINEEIKYEIKEDIESSIKIDMKEYTLCLSLMRHGQYIIYKVKNDKILEVYKIEDNEFASDEFLEKLRILKSKLYIRYSKMIENKSRFRNELYELMRYKRLIFFYNEELDVVEGKIFPDSKGMVFYMSKDGKLIDFKLDKEKEEN